MIDITQDFEALLTTSQSTGALLQNATVHIVEDDPDLQEIFAENFATVGLNTKTYSDGRDFLDRLPGDGAGCVFIDIRMPGMSGLELQDRLQSLALLLPVIMMSGHGDISIAVRAMKAGAFDFIDKPFNLQNALEIAQRAIAHSIRINMEFNRKKQEKEIVNMLSARERQVLNHVLAGDKNKNIAELLGISIRTVEVHRGKMMRKMNVGSMAELVRASAMAQ
ncbi:MAG: response regulator transcription factor [Rhodospirillales bacterium]|nr:response regulator transcription factor [Rhodospirillales bacterium]